MSTFLFRGFREEEGFVHKAVPSKSFTHRYLILMALAGENSSMLRPLHCEDSLATLRALEMMGTAFYFNGTREIQVMRGLDLESKSLKTNAYGITRIHCGESGSTLRFMMALALRYENPITFEGREGLAKRPLDSYIEFFERYGIEYQWEGRLPITLKGPLLPGRYEIDCGVSSQYASGLLMLLSSYEEESILSLRGEAESLPYINMTISALRRFGKIIDISGKDIILRPSKLRPSEVRVEGDYSQAAYFMAMGALGRGCRILDLDPWSLQGDRAILDILSKLGVGLSFTEDGESETGLALVIEGSRLRAAEVDVRDCPDLAPVTALLMSLAEGSSRITGCRRLAFKESDRLLKTAEALNEIGARVTIDGDSMLIEGVKRLRGGYADCANDHRLAMMLAAASLRAERYIYVEKFECVAKSYMGFLKDFGLAGGDYDEYLG